MKTFGTAVAFFAVVFFVIWLAGMPKGVKPLTGKDCVEVIDRIFAQRKTHSPTPAEEADMELCKGP